MSANASDRASAQAQIVGASAGAAPHSVDAAASVTGVPVPPSVTPVIDPNVIDPVAFTFIQSTPATLWEVVHNLGRFPRVVVTDSVGTHLYTTVQYIDFNTLIVKFSQPFAGRVYCY